MDLLDTKLNDILVDTFRIILKAEEQAIRDTGGIDLSISEMHLMEAIGRRKEGRTVSSIAEELGVTLPAVTVAIGRLLRKGYVEKTRSEDDGRLVLVSLTKLGHKMNHAHGYFHEQMIRDIVMELSAEEKEIFMNGISRLNQFFKRKYADMEKK